VKPFALLVIVGLVLVAVVGWVGRGGALIGGAVALASQLAAVALLRPAMAAPNPEFMARWLGGMGIRALALGTLLAVSATHRAALPLMATMLGFLGVLLPLLFVEIRFLK
jgi:hypothetical protein